MRASVCRWALLALVPTVAATPAWGQETLHWDVNGTSLGEGGSGTWDQSSPVWSLSTDGVSGPFRTWDNSALDDAFFAGTTGTVTLSEPITVHNITFRTNSYKITGSTLTLDGLNPTIDSGDGGGINQTISSVIHGTSGLTKIGTGTLTLTGNNSFVGGLIVNAGTLSVTGNNSFGSAPIIAGGGLSLTGTNSFVGDISVNGALTASGAAALGDAGNNIKISGGSLNIGTTGGDLAGRTITLSGVGRVSLSGAGIGMAHFTGTGGLTINPGVNLTDDTNDYTGQTAFGGAGGTTFTSVRNLGEASSLGAPTTVADGTIYISNPSGTAGTRTAIYIGDGDVSNRNWSLTSNGYRGTSLSNNGTGTLTLTGDIAVNKTTYAYAPSFIAATADLELLGVISGNNVVFSANAGQVLRLGDANTFSTVTVSGAGKVEAATLADVGVASSLGAGNSASVSGTLSYTGAGASTDRFWSLSGTLSNDGTGALTLSGGMGIGGTATLGGSYTGADNVASGVISGAGNLRGAGAGTWVISGANTYTGQTIVDSGTLRAGSAGAFTSSNSFQINGGTLDLNGYDQTLTTLTGTGGTLNLGSAGLTIVGPTGTTASFGGGIAGSGGLTKLGNSVQTLTGASTYTGDTAIGGGTLALDFSTAGGPTSNIIGSDSTLVMSGGTLTVTGAANESDTQTFDGLKITAGNNTISAVSGTGGSMTVNLGAITRTGGLMNFNLPTDGSITTTNTSLGGWATVNGTDYAKVVGGSILAFTDADYTDKDNAANWLDNEFITDVAGFFGTVTGTKQLGGLRYTQPVSTTVNVDPGETLGVDGTIIVAPTVLGGNQLITGGMMTGANGGVLGVQQNSTGNFTIASQIVDNGAGMGFTKAGTGLVTLTNTANSYTGATRVVQGTLAVTSIGDGGVASSIGASSADPSNLVLEGSTLSYTGTGDTSDRGFTFAKSGAILGAGIAVTNANANLILSGQVISTDGAGFTKSGAGTLTLANPNNAFAGAVAVTGGLLAVDTLVNGGEVSPIGQSSSDPANLTLSGGGGLRYTGTTTTTDRGFTLGGGGGVVDVSTLGTTLNVSGQVAGGGSLTKNGAGALVLTAANSYTGGNIVNGGILRAGAANVLGSSGPMTLADTAGVLLDLNNFNNVIGALNGGGANGGNVTLGSARLQINGGNGNYSGTISGTGGILRTGNGTQVFNGCNNDYTGPTTLQGGTISTDCLADGGMASGIGASSADPTNLVFNGGSLTYSGGSIAIDRGFQLLGAGGINVADAGTTLEIKGAVIGGGTLVKRSPGTLVLSGVNTSTGNTQVEGGVLRAGTVNAFGPQGEMTLLNTAGVLLDLAGFDTAVSSLVGGGASGGNIDLGSATLTILDGVNRTYAGAITGSGNLVKSGTRIQALSGCDSNYTGSTTISGGTLQVTCLENGGVNSSIGASSSDAANLVINGTLRYIGAATSTDRQFTIGASGATLDSSGAGPVEFTYAGPATLAPGTGPRTVTLTGSNTGVNLLAAQLDDGGAGVTSLAKTGNGTWRLSNQASTYTGATTISGGILIVDKLADGGQASTIGASTNAASNLVIGNGSTLRYVGTGDTTDRQFTLDTGVTYIQSSGTGALVFANTGTVGLTGTNATRTIALGGTNTDLNTMGGAIADNGTGATTLAKNDSGTWVLTGNNSYTGNTVINDGNLMIGNGGTTGNAGAGNVIVDKTTSTLSLNRSDDFVFSGTLSGPGTLAQIGGGTSILTSALNDIGATTISAGALQVDGALTTPTIAMTGTSALTVNGTVWAGVGSPATLSGDGGANTVTVNAGGALTANGDLGDGADTVSLAGTLATGTAALSLGLGNDTLVLRDGGAITGVGVDAGAGTDTLVVDNALAYTLDSSSAAGFESLTKQNGGVLTLTGDHAYGAGTTIAAGTLRIGNGGTSGTLAGDIIDNATLAFNRSGTLTIAGRISGTGSVDQLGPGTTVLTADNDYAGGTTIAAGTLQIGAGGTTGSITGDVANGGTLAFNRSDDLTFEGVVSGTGSLRKLGAGTLTLTADNSYSGLTTIAAGTLRLGDGGTSGGLAGNVLDKGTLVFDRSDTASFAGLISGSGGVEQAGTGTTVLTGANSYAGATTVSAGTLLVDGDQSAATGPTSVASGATLGGSGTIGGDVAVADGGILAPGSNGVGALTINGNLSLAGASRLDFQFGEANAPGSPLNDALAVGGDLTLDGTIDVSVSPGGSFDIGLYRIASYGGALNDQGLAVGAMPPGADMFVQTAIADQVNLINTGGATLNFWDGAAGPKFDDAVNGGSGTWQNSSGNDNWTEISGAVNAPFSDDAVAIFSAAPGTVTVDDSLGAVAAAGMQFASDGYRITGNALTLTAPQSVIRVGDGTAAGAGIAATIDAPLIGAAQLVKTDAGTLVLSGVNGYTGGTLIDDGTLRISSDANLGDAAGALTLGGATLNTTASFGSSRAVNLAGAGTFDVNNATLLTLDGTVSGSGALAKHGGGTLVLTGANTYGGGTTIDAGILQIGSGGTTGSITGDVVDNSSLVFNRSDGVAFDGAISGTGALTKLGAGALTLTADNSYTGLTTIASGTLRLGAGGTTGGVAGDVVDDGRLVFDRSNEVDFAGLISGAGIIEQAGSGTTILTADNSYTGQTFVSGGTLLVNGDQSAATGATTVSPSATLGGTGIIGGSVAIADGGAINPGDSGSAPGVLTIAGNLDLAPAAVLNYDFGQANVAGGPLNDLIDVGGDLTLGGTLNVTASAGGSFDPGIYRVINYGGTLGGSGLAIGTIPSGTDFYVQTSVTGQVNLINTDGLALRFWDGASGIRNDGVITGGDGVWQNVSGNDNWTLDDASINAPYLDSAFAIFGGIGGTVTVDQSLGAINVAGMQFASDGYAVEGDPISLTGAPAVIRVGDGMAAGAAITATIASELLGASQLVKTDLGTLVLSGANGYSGGTAINGGTLRISADANLGDAAGGLSFDGGTLNTTADIASNRAVDLVGAGTFLTDSGTTLTLGGGLSGAGSLTKDGDGAIVLTEANAYAGDTLVRAGGLFVDGDQTAATGRTSVATGAILGGSGIIGGDVTLADGATLAPGTNGVGTLTINGNIALSAGSVLDFAFGEANVAGGSLNDLVDVGGDLTLDGTINVSVPAGGSFGPGVYRVFNYGGALVDNGLALGALPGGSDVSVQTAIAGQVNLVNTAGLTLSFWDGAIGPKNDGAVDGGNGVWRVGGGSNNWTDLAGTLNADYAQDSFAIFSAAPGTVTVDNGGGDVLASGMQFASDGYVIDGGPLTLSGTQAIVQVGDGSVAGAGYTATITAELAGSAGLVKTDAGTLVLTGTNSYTGGTAINGGTLRISSDANLGDATGGLSFDGGTLNTTASFGSTRAIGLAGTGTVATDNATTLDLGGEISGGGALVKQGDGILVLTGDNSYAGGTIIGGGTLQLGNGGTTGSLVGDVTDNGALVFDRSNTLTLGGAITGAGSVSQVGSGTTVLTGDSAYGGGTTISAGALQLGDGGTTGNIAGDVANDGALVFNRSNQLVFAGSISGSGSVTQAGSGTTILTGDSAYAGGTTISAGALQLGDGGTTGSITGDVTDNGTLVFNRSNVATFGGTISGIGSVSQTGTGTTILTGANSYVGATNISGGTLLVNGDQSLATGLTSVAGGGTLGGTGTIGGDVFVGSGAILAPGSGGVGTLTVAGDLAFSPNGSLSVEFGQANVPGGPLNDLVDVRGDLTLDGTIDVAQAAGGSFGPGVYRVINYAGTLTDNGLTVGSLPGGTAFVQTAIANQVNLVNTAGLALNFWDGAAGPKNDGAIQGSDGVWRLGGGQNDWTEVNGAVNADYAQDSFAIFQGTGGTVTIDNGGGDVRAAGMQFTVDGYAITGQSLTLTGAQAFIRTGDGGTGDSGITTRIDAALTGSARLVKDMGGTLVLTGVNSYTGGTAINGGTLRISADANLGDAAGGLSFDGGTLHTTADIGSNRTVDLAGAGTFLTDGGTTFTLGGIVSGGGALTKGGAGTLVLAADNSYAGGTTIAAGTLQLGNGGTTGTIIGDVTDDGVLAFDRSNTLALAGTITGTGSVGQIGSGTTILTGANSYAGATDVTGGTLLVNGDQTAATGLTSVASGARLGGTGTIGGDVVVADGGVLAPGAGGAGALAINGDLSLATGAKLAYDFGAANAPGSPLNDVVNVGGDLTLDGTLDVAVTPGGAFDIGLYRIANYGGAFTDNGLAIGVTPSGADVFVQTSVAGQVNLINTGSTVLNFWDGAAGPKFNGAVDGGDGIWQNGTGNDNWADTTGAVNAPFDDGAFAIFTGTAGAVTIDDSLGAVTASGLQFATGGYTIAGDALTLTGPRSTIRVGDGTTAGASYTATIASAITGVTQLVKTDLGTLVLTGTNSYAGGTAINGGTLRISADANLGHAAGGLSLDGGTLNTAADLSSARAVELAGTGTFLTDANTTLDLGGAIVGAGSLTKSGAGTLMLSGTGTYTGATTVAAGTLLVDGDYSGATGATDVASGASLGGRGTIGGDVTLADAAILTPGGRGAGTLTIDGDLSLAAGTTLAYEFGAANVAGGALNDLVNVAGDLVLDGTIDVTVPAGGAFGAGVYRMFNYGGSLTDNGLALGAMPGGSDVTVQTSIAGQVNLVNSAGLMLSFWDGAAGPKDNNAVNGGTGIWQNGTGNDNWTDASGAVNAAYSDGTFAVFEGTAGTVTVDSSLGDVAASGMQFAAGGYTITGDAVTLTGPQSTIRVGDGSTAGAAFTATIDAALSGDAQMVKTDAGTLVLGGVNSYTGGTAINGGTVQIASDANLGAASGDVTLDGGTLGTSATLTSARTVTLAGVGTIATADATVFTLDGQLAGAGALEKAGAGTLLLTGDSSGYTGATTVSAGTLAVTGTLGGAVTVDGGGRLEGTGSVGSVANAGIVAPGRDGFGTLTVDGSYTGSAGTLEIEAALGGDASETDRLVVTNGSAGTTQLVVVNRGGLGAQTAEGIKIVDVTGGASNGTFTLKGDYDFEGSPAVIAGAYGYRLFQGGVATPTDGDWYLRSALLDVPSAPLYQPGVPIYETYLHTLQTLNGLPTLQQRVGNRQWSGFTNSGVGMWGRMESTRYRPEAAVSTTGADLAVNDWDLQVGFDATVAQPAGGTLIAGINGRYGSADARIGSRFGNGSIDTERFAIGGTLTWYGADGLYADAQAQRSWYNSDLKSDTLGSLIHGNDGWGETYSLELGQRLPVDGNLSLTPQAQIVYSNVRFHGFADPARAAVSAEDGDSLRGRLGLSLDHQHSWAQRGGGTARTHFYAIANLQYEMLDGNRVDVSGTPLLRRDDRLWGELGIGGSYSWGDGRFTLFSEASADTALSNFGDSNSVRANAGFRMRF